MLTTGDSETIHHLDGRVELRDPAAISASPLYNNDLAPVPMLRRVYEKGVTQCSQ